MKTLRLTLAGMILPLFFIGCASMQSDGNAESPGFDFLSGAGYINAFDAVSNVVPAFCVGLSATFVGSAGDDHIIADLHLALLDQPLPCSAKRFGQRRCIKGNGGLAG